VGLQQKHAQVSQLYQLGVLYSAASLTEFGEGHESPLQILRAGFVVEAPAIRDTQQ